MATTSDGIWTPDSVDTFALVNDLAAMAASIQTALTRRANSYTGTTTQREAFTATAPEGTLWSDTNGEKILWIKQGASWQKVWLGGIDTVTTIGLNAGWVAVETLQVVRENGWAHLEGTIRRDTGSLTSPGAVVPGFLPTRRLRFSVPTENPGQTVGPPTWMEIATNGDMHIHPATGGATWTASTWFYMPSTPWKVAA